MMTLAATSGSSLGCFAARSAIAATAAAVGWWRLRLLSGGGGVQWELVHQTNIVASWEGAETTKQRN
jgi:hypothetical protein